MVHHKGSYFSSVKTHFLSVLLIMLSCFAKAQDPLTADPNNPIQIPATQMPPSQLYEALKDKNPGNLQGQKTIGNDKNKLKNKIDRDSLVKESTPQSTGTTDDIYGMNLFRGGAVAEITELSTPPLDYPIGVYDQIIVSLWNGAEATVDYQVARDGSIFPSGIGKIYIQGLTFENMRSLIISRFKSFVPPSPQTTYCQS